MNRLAHKIPVEPLDEQRVQRVERAVMTAYRAAPAPLGASVLLRAARWLAPAALAAAAVIGYVALTRDDAPAWPARVETGGSATTMLLGDARVVLGPNTTANVTRGPDGVWIDLDRGTVGCEVEPIPGRAPLTVRAGEVEVAVIGTVFRVERDDGVRVAVQRGRVRVRGPAGVRELAAGQAWSSEAGLLAADDAEPPGQGPGETSTGAAPPSRPADTAAGERAVAGGVAAGARGPDAPRGEHVARAPVVERKVSGRRQAAAAVDATSPAQRLEAISRMLRADTTITLAEGTEAELIEQLGSERGPRAARVLYSLAHRNYVRGRYGDALRFAHQYERRFQNGAEAEAALAMRIAILCMRDDLKACRAAAHSYLRRFPTGRLHDLAGEIIHWGM